MTVALDATYSLGRHLTGVGAFSRALLFGLAAARTADRFLFCYRPHRFLASLREALPANASRRLLHEWTPIGSPLFHGLNQRLPPRGFRRTVTTFHDLFVLTGDYSTPDFRRRFAAQAREAAAGSDLIVTVSHFTASQVDALLNVPRARLRVVSHGVDLPSPAERAGPRESWFLHVGALQTRKNLLRLLFAFERTPPPWRLVLAGSDGFGAEHVHAAIAASTARDRIDTLGYVDAPALRSLYSRASILVFPSLDEGFGMPVLEGMAWGMPVITSNGSALAEVAGDAALLVAPTEVNEISEAMLRLIEDEPLRARLLQLGLQRAAAHPWRNAIEGYWKVYRELL
ncbi:MAG: glycosyltransferase family 1 protein [Bryobacteraceae bacterium]|nr:glycosyltransferase family 1 protein [Bryobacteraceae bacterium]